MLVVVEDEKVIGLVTVGNIGELLALESAGHEISQPAAPSPAVNFRSRAGTS
jgi:hypothetical protein